LILCRVSTSPKPSLLQAKPLPIFGTGGGKPIMPWPRVSGTSAGGGCRRAFSTAFWRRIAIYWRHGRRS
jgi:hypothetical protein